MYTVYCTVYLDMKSKLRLRQGISLIDHNSITFISDLLSLKGHGNEADFLGFCRNWFLIIGYTHKTSRFKTSDFKTSGFKTSETSGLQNVRFTKHQVYFYRMSGLQNVRSSKSPVAKKHPYIYCTCGWWKSAGSVAATFAGTGMAVFYSLF